MKHFFYTLQVVIPVLFLKKNAIWRIGTFINVSGYKLQSGDLIFRSSLNYMENVIFLKQYYLLFFFILCIKYKFICIIAEENKTNSKNDYDSGLFDVGKICVLNYWLFGGSSLSKFTWRLLYFVNSNSMVVNEL